MIPNFRRSRDLVAARIQAHWAAQVVSALGTALLPHREDYSETNLGWDHDRQALMGRSVQGVTAGLRVADLVWLVAGPRPAERSAVGSTIADGLRWLHSVAVENGLANRPLDHGSYDLPPHELARGGRFELVSGLDEVAAWFDVASLAIGRIAEGARGADEVRCWPHNFDLATLLPLGTGRTIGVGLSPGDADIPEPYFYVTPHPRPEPGEGPVVLPSGRWNERGWFGAVLRGSEIPSDDPRTAVDGFLDAAVEACRGTAAGSLPS
jgi:hypothetical protein